MTELKQVKVILGRFQPFTLGHLKIATYTNLKGPDEQQTNALREQPNLEEIAKLPTVILQIEVPEEKVTDKKPFPTSLMKKELDIIKKEYKEIVDVLYVTNADICAFGEKLKQNGYQAAVWVTGSDEYEKYKPMILKIAHYEETTDRDFKDACTKSFYLENVERVDDSDDFIASISGTKVRNAISTDDKETFKKMMPKGTDVLFDDFKLALETAPKEPEKKKRKVKEQMKPLKDFINEKIN